MNLFDAESDELHGDRFDALRSSAVHEWETPPSIFLPLHAEFGFTVDAAASINNALLPRFWTEMDDGLLKTWDEEVVWCNPPYGPMQKAFIRKAYESTGTSVLLIPARTDTAIWHECIHGIAEVRFVAGRIRFIVNNQIGDSAPFASAIVIYRGSHKRRIIESPLLEWQA